MRFRSHQCWFPRDAEKPRDYEDASARSEKWGRAVIADGVSSAVFSRIWARLLTRAAVLDPPTFATDEDIAAWLQPLQHSWREEVRQAKITVPLWAVMPKITAIGGQATLLSVQLEPVFGNEGPVADTYRLIARAIGDSILYVVRGGEKIASFPITESETFEEPPWAFSSLVKDVKYGSHIQHLETECRVGDLLVLCTDAIGKWSMREYEEGRPVDWMRYWEDDAKWHEDICRLRTKQSSEPGPRLVVDDCTLLLLEVVAETAVENEPDTAPDRSDEPFVLLAAPSFRDDTAGPGVAAANVVQAVTVDSLPVADNALASESRRHEPDGVTCDEPSVIASDLSSDSTERLPAFDESREIPGATHPSSESAADPKLKRADEDQRGDSALTPELHPAELQHPVSSNVSDAEALPPNDVVLKQRQPRGGLLSALSCLLRGEARKAKHGAADKVRPDDLDSGPTP